MTQFYNNQKGYLTIKPKNALPPHRRKNSKTPYRQKIPKVHFKYTDAMRRRCNLFVEIIINFANAA